MTVVAVTATTTAAAVDDEDNGEDDNALDDDDKRIVLFVIVFCVASIILCAFVLGNAAVVVLYGIVRCLRESNQQGEMTMYPYRGSQYSVKHQQQQN